MQMTAKPPKVPSAALAAANAISEQLLRVVRPFFWQRRRRILNGASAFVLRFDERYVGVTADHVIEHYLSALDACPSVRCQLGECWVSPEKTMIGRSRGLDLATFEVDPLMLAAMGADAIDCRTNWPPPVIRRGDSLTLAGFLDNHRSERLPGYYEHQAWGAHTIAEDATERNVVVTYSPDGVSRATPDVQKPPLKFNMSGCSGGLAVSVQNVNGLLRWAPAAVIYKGPSGESHGGFADFDVIKLRPLGFIRSDGTFYDAVTGWLAS
jgi:hypothetical protein